VNQTTQGLESVLAQHRFFRELRPDHVKLLAGCAKNVVFQPGEYLFRQGQDADALYVIREGLISLELSAAGKGTIVIATAGSDEVVGWSWMVSPHRWRYSGKATQLTRAVAVDGKCLRGKCDDDHDLGYSLLWEVVRILAHRLEATRIQLLDVYGSEGKG